MSSYVFGFQIGSIFFFDLPSSVLQEAAIFLPMSPPGHSSFCSWQRAFPLSPRPRGTLWQEHIAAVDGSICRFALLRLIYPNVIQANRRSAMLGGSPFSRLCSCISSDNTIGIFCIAPMPWPLARTHASERGTRRRPRDTIGGTDAKTLRDRFGLP